MSLIHQHNAENSLSETLKRGYSIAKKPFDFRWLADQGKGVQEPWQKKKPKHRGSGFV